jgi:hypothetical protein
MANLEEILQTYFGCKVPFRKDGEFTTTGIEAYKKLEDLLQDLHALGVIPSASDAVRKLDEITHEGDEPEEDRTVLDEGIEYVHQNISAPAMAIIRAKIDLNYEAHLSPACGVDCSKVIDLLEEYGDENDLPEGWWEEYADIDEIILKL